MADAPERLLQPLRFDWDEGNSEKSWERHGVRQSECEEVFGGRPLLVSDDLAHSESEPRHLALGRTRAERRLFVVFTMRAEGIRVISARDMNRKERRTYDAACEEEVDQAASDLP